MLMLTATPCASYRYTPLRQSEAAALLRHIRRGLAELDRLAVSGQLLADELTQFMAQYYARVLPWCERLEALRHAGQYGTLPPRTLFLGERDALAVPLFPADPVEQKRKALFRRLAKACHPDTAEASRPLGGIARVYEARMLSALWLLEISRVARQLEGFSWTDYLETQRAEIGGLIRAARARETAIRSSGFWQLRQRAACAAEEGNDFIATVVARLRQRIAAMQHNYVPA